MNMPSPLAEITLTRIAATEHKIRFPGPMLEVPWHVSEEHVKPTANRQQRVLIPALARTLSARGTTLGVPTFSARWRLANGLQEPPKWFLGVFRRPMTPIELRKAYDVSCIWISDIITYDWRTNQARLQQQQHATTGRSDLVKQIKRWTDCRATTSPEHMNQQERFRLREAFLPSTPQPPGPPPDVPFTMAEITRVYGQRPPSMEEKWVAYYTDGSVVQQNGRTMGVFAGTSTQGPATLTEFTSPAEWRSFR